MKSVVGKDSAVKKKFEEKHVQGVIPLSKKTWQSILSQNGDENGDKHNSSKYPL